MLHENVFFVADRAGLGAAFWGLLQDEKAINAEWLAKVAAMPPAEQSTLVAAKLRELNPPFDEKVAFKADGNKLTEYVFSGNGVEDITPLAALKHLRRLVFSGTQPMSRGPTRIA